MEGYLGDIALIVLAIILAVIFIPILIGGIIAFLFGVSGYNYYVATFLIAIIFWVCLFCIFYYEVYT